MREAVLRSTASFYMIYMNQKIQTPSGISVCPIHIKGLHFSQK